MGAFNLIYTGKLENWNISIFMKGIYQIIQKEGCDIRGKRC
jgi:hypothetical protein